MVLYNVDNEYFSNGPDFYNRIRKRIILRELEDIDKKIKKRSNRKNKTLQERKLELEEELLLLV